MADRKRSQVKESKVLHIGDKLRSKYTIKDFITGDQVSAPSSMDEVVISMVMSFLTYCEEPSLFVDSFPRNMRQLMWLRDYKALHKNAQIFLCHVQAKFRVRLFRYLKRSDVSLSTLYYFIKREWQDRKVMRQVLEFYNKQEDWSSSNISLVGNRQEIL